MARTLRQRLTDAVRALRGQRSMVGPTVYTAARTDRLTSDWLSTLIDPSDESRLSSEKLRGRARALRRNNPIVARLASLVEANVIGPDGLTLQAQPGNSRGTVNEALARQAERLYYDWAERAGVDGRPLNAIYRDLATQWRVDAGEGLLEFVYDERLPMGLGVQVLDSDLLDADYNAPARNGRGEIIGGVELNALGQMAGLHVWIDHPAAPGGRRDRRFIPADRLACIWHRPRPGMVRGVTPLAPAMLRLQMLGGTQEALVILHRIAASKMGWWVKRAGADDFADGGTTSPSAPMDATPGTTDFAPDGYEFAAWDPGQPTQQYEPFSKSLLRECAASQGVSYMSLSGDLSDTSFSSGRMGLEPERDHWKTLQQEFASAICQPVYVAFLRAARLAGAIQRPDSLEQAAFERAAWHGRRWGYIEPLKDAEAAATLIRAGLTTLTRELNARGLDIGEVLAERARETDMAAQLGVALDFGGTANAPAATDASAPMRRLEVA